ncbi:MAG: hypothetical protein AAF657_18245 [Acidobacteriota bacterium]
MFQTLCRPLFVSALLLLLAGATSAQVAIDMEGPAQLVDIFALDGGGNPVGPAWDSLVADGEITLTNGSVLPPGSTLFPGDEIAEGLLLNMDPNPVMVIFVGGYSPVVPAGQALLIAAAAGIRCVDQSNSSTVEVGTKMCLEESTWTEPYSNSEQPDQACPGDDNKLTEIKSAAVACQAAAAIVGNPPNCVSPCVPQTSGTTDTESKVAGKSCTVTRTRTCVPPGDN